MLRHPRRDPAVSGIPATPRRRRRVSVDDLRRRPAPLAERV